ncbi:MAG: ATP-binding cassette domain-containing protein [Chloroflexia bacterium]
MIETQGLTKSFKTRQGEVEAVRGVDLQVQVGDIFGFLGPNGAGKTTTMRMLATLLEPTGGQARVCGYDLLRQPGQVRTKIGYVSQTGGTIPSDSARENLVLQGRLYGMSNVEARTRAQELIEKFDLTPFADRRALTYSGGQRRRLDTAMSIMHLPTLLFLDEPTTGLDPQSRTRVWDEVRRLHDAGMTIFLTTHYLDEADALCDRLAIIDNGRIVSEGTPDSLKRQVAGDRITLGLNLQNGTGARVDALLRAQPFVHELHPFDGGLNVYVERGEEALPIMLRLLDPSGVTLQTVMLARPTLDDVFLKLTGRSLRETDAKTA